MMVVVGRKHLALLMTTNRASAFADTQFGCGREIIGSIQFMLLNFNCPMVQLDERLMG